MPLANPVTNQQISRRKHLITWFIVLFCAAIPPLILAVWPPELLRVGASYSAKIVCSNVFLAGRDPVEVLREDVQAPGNPLLRLVSVQVDSAQQRVNTNFLGFIAPTTAVYRSGTGCATVPDGDLVTAQSFRFVPPAIPTPSPQLAWPAGSAAQTNTELQALLNASDLVGPNLRAALVIHKGQLIAERYGAGFTAETPLLGWSLTKTVTAVLVGMLIREGNLSLEQDHFWDNATADGREKIKVADLLAMSSGLAFNEEYGDVSDVTRMLFLEPDMAAFAHKQPLEHPVGSHWHYASGSTVLLSRIWQTAAGSDSLSFPHQHLFTPLGMSNSTFEADARGNLVGASYLYASAHDWARFGQFLLQEGVWNGQQLLPDGYVRMMQTAAPASKGEYGSGQVWQWGSVGPRPKGVNLDNQFHLPDDTYWMLGHDGQSIAIIPSQQLLVIRLGLTPSNLGYQPHRLVAAMLKAVQK